MTKIKINNDGFIIRAGSALPDEETDHVYEGDKELTGGDPLRQATCWHWNGGDPEERETGNPQPPEPSEAMQEIVAYYASLNQDADNPTKAGRIQLNAFLSSYPGAQGALQAGEYDELMGSGGYFEIAVEDSDLPDFDSAMRTDLEEILQGKKSYL